ncbi:MAG: hypothetical protein HGA75_12390 [Thiobacillus sp.]|nr:hypothetical protein [Thiobacillus sp.]
MIRDKFRRRMLLAAVLPTMIFTALLSLVWINWIHQELETARQTRAEAIARQLATAAEFHLFSGNLAALQTLLKATSMEERDIVGMAIFDRRGVRLVAAGEVVGLANPAAHAVWVGADHDGRHRLVLPIRTVSLVIDDLAADGAAPDDAGTDHLLGYVVLVVSDASLIEKRNTVLYLAGLLMLLAMVAGGLLAAFMSQGIVNSISGMISVVRRIGQGDLAARIDPDPECVLYPLEEGINRMAEKVSLSQEDLKRRIDEATSELQAQKRTAEHEARADPLTRLLGFFRHFHHPSHISGPFGGRLGCRARRAGGAGGGKFARGIQALRHRFF